MTAFHAAKASQTAPLAVVSPVAITARPIPAKGQGLRRKKALEDEQETDPQAQATGASDTEFPSKSEPSSSMLLAQATKNGQENNQSRAKPALTETAVLPSPAQSVELESITSFLLKPMTAHTASTAASWFGAAPTGAVLSGTFMGLLALQSNNKTVNPAPDPDTDTTAPQLTGADISNAAGNQLILRYNESLNFVLPAANAFEVMLNGINTPVASVALGSDATSVVLTLSNAITRSSDVTVTVSTRDGSAIKDLAGNVAATFRDQAVSVTDQTAPTLLVTLPQRTVPAITNTDSSILVLRFSETLQSNTVLDPASFGVSVSGTPQSISAAEVFGDSIRLTLANKITGSAPIVLLSYTPPADTSKAIQDSAGNRILAFGPSSSVDGSGGFTVTHAVDTTAPFLNSDAAAVAATTRQVRVIRLNFSESLDASALPSPSSFVVSVAQDGNNSSVAVSSLQLLGSVLELTLATAVTDSLAGLRVDYVVPSTGHVLQDWAGNPVPAFDRSVVTVDAVAPSMVSSRFTNDRTLELTFGETLASHGPNADAWRLTANGGNVLTPKTSTVAGRTLILGFESAIQGGQALSLAYTAPATDPSTLNPALQDILGNDSSGFSRTLDTTAPSLTSAVTSANGLQILLNYDDSLLSPNNSSSPVIPAVSTSAFAVFNGFGDRISVSSVNVSGTLVQLNLATALKPGDTVSVFYTVPTASIGVNNAAVQDVSGNDAASLGSGVVGQAVTNNTAMAVARVQLGSQSLALDEVVVQFNEALGTGSLPDISAFTVKAGTVTQTITGIARDSTDNTKLVLTLNATADDPGALLVSYAAPSSNPITGASGKALGSFNDQNFGQLITSTSATDTVTGAAGRVDYFLGSAGNDTLSGQGGADQFVWPDFGNNGPGGFTQTLTDFGFKRGTGNLQGNAEADLLDLSQLLNGYTQDTEATFLRAIKTADNKLLLQIDHDGGTTFTPTANLVFNNVTVNNNDQLLVNGQFIAHTVGATTVNLTLSTLVEHLRVEGQLTVL